MRAFLFAAALAALSHPAAPQQLCAPALSSPQADWNVSVVAGGGVGFGGSALSAPMYSVMQMAYNGTDLLLAIMSNGPGPTMLASRVVRVAADGTLLPFAGTGLYGCDSGNGGPALIASLFTPFGVAVNAATGDVFISGFYGHSVRVVRGATGLIGALFGTPGSSGFQDGPSPKANSPGRLQWDAARSALVFCDVGNNRLRAWNGSYAFTWAGNGTTHAGADPARALNATLPCAGVALMGGRGGGAFVADATSHRVRFVNISDAAVFSLGGDFSNASTATTIAGSGSAGRRFLAAPPASNIVLTLAAHGAQGPGSDVLLIGPNMSAGLLLVAEGTRAIRALNCSRGLGAAAIHRFSWAPARLPSMATGSRHSLQTWTRRGHSRQCPGRRALCTLTAAKGACAASRAASSPAWLEGLNFRSTARP